MSALYFAAIQNQDFTVIDDYITGLKTLLYLDGIEELENWDGQSPPTARTYKGKGVSSVQDVIGKTLPNFGPYARQKKELIAERKVSIDLLEENTVKVNRPAFEPKKMTPKVAEVIGRALDAIGTYNDLDNKYIYTVLSSLL